MFEVNWTKWLMSTGNSWSLPPSSGQFFILPKSHKSQLRKILNVQQYQSQYRSSEGCPWCPWQCSGFRTVLIRLYEMQILICLYFSHFSQLKDHYQSWYRSSKWHPRCQLSFELNPDREVFEYGYMKYTFWFAWHFVTDCWSNYHRCWDKCCEHNLVNFMCGLWEEDLWRFFTKPWIFYLRVNCNFFDLP